MTGEINVAAIWERQAQLRAWQVRQARDAEWEALKQWWRAERLVRKATSAADRQRAVALRATTVRLYRRELRRAWPKWAKAQEELNARTQGRL